MAQQWQVQSLQTLNHSGDGTPDLPGTAGRLLQAGGLHLNKQLLNICAMYAICQAQALLSKTQVGH
jgi:hypothetical protein